MKLTEADRQYADREALKHALRANADLLRQCGDKLDRMADYVCDSNEIAALAMAEIMTMMQKLNLPGIVRLSK